MLLKLRKKADPPPVSNNMKHKQQTFTALVRALQADMFRYAYWLCGNRALAEDLVQESFLRAWKALDSLRDEKAAKAWLITIIRREHARHYERYTPEFVDIEQQYDLGSADPEMGGESLQLRRAMSSLSAEYREPLVLQIIGGFSGEEIANILELNENTVATRLFRARKQLKDLFSEPAPAQKAKP